MRSDSNLDHVELGRVRLDDDLSSWHEPSGFRYFEKAHALIQKAGDHAAVAWSLLREKDKVSARQLTAGEWNRIAVRIDGGVAEEVVETVKHTVRDSVL